MRPFTDTLNQLRFGTLSEDLTKALHELTAGRTRSTGKDDSMKLDDLLLALCAAICVALLFAPLGTPGGWA